MRLSSTHALEWLISYLFVCWPAASPVCSHSVVEFWFLSDSALRQTNFYFAEFYRTSQQLWMFKRRWPSGLPIRWAIRRNGPELTEFYRLQILKISWIKWQNRFNRRLLRRLANFFGDSPTGSDACHYAPITLQSIKLRHYCFTSMPDNMGFWVASQIAP